MSGAVAPITKPLGRAFGGIFGFGGRSSAPAPAPAEKVIEKPSRMDEEQGARMRGARRRGRQLLSDARLNPEAGIETLGSGQNL
jgi:hypothetical protein